MYIYIYMQDALLGHPPPPTGGYTSNFWESGVWTVFLDATNGAGIGRKDARKIEGKKLSSSDWGRDPPRFAEESLGDSWQEPCTTRFAVKKFSRVLLVFDAHILWNAETGNWTGIWYCFQDHLCGWLTGVTQKQSATSGASKDLRCPKCKDSTFPNRLKTVSVWKNLAFWMSWFWESEFVWNAINSKFQWICK